MAKTKKKKRKHIEPTCETTSAAKTIKARTSAPPAPIDGTITAVHARINSVFCECTALGKRIDRIVEAIDKSKKVGGL